MNIKKLDLIQNKRIDLERKILTAKKSLNEEELAELKEELQWVKEIERKLWEEIFL